MSDRRPTRDVTAARPNPVARWQCGYAHLGYSCVQGPNAQGECGRGLKSAADDDCRIDGGTGNPSVLSSTEASFDGDELGPCVPQLSSRFSRSSLAINVAVLTVAGLLICMALPQREALFVPGGLSRKHAQILDNRLVSERCSLCHPAAHPGAISQVHQADLCLKCHAEHLPDAHLASPHDLARDHLTELWGATPGGLMFPVSAPRTSGQSLDCASCHLEHQGDSFDLKAMDDARCQACHQVQFASLSDGHPQFRDYPYRSERRIAFDHAAHEQKHFSVKSEAFDCRRCHVDGSRVGEVGPVFRSLGFERACASCHAESIQAAMADGWALMSAPSIEAWLADDAAAGLADWPRGAQFGSEGEITMPLRLLLQSDSECAGLLRDLPSSGRIQDAPLHLRDELAAGLARGFRRLIADIAAGGQSAWKARLTSSAEISLGRSLNEHEVKLVQALSAGLPPDLFRQAEMQWFTTASTVAEVRQNYLHMASQLSGQDELLGDDSLPPGYEADDLVLGAESSQLDDSSDDALLLGDGLSANADDLLGGNSELSDVDDRRARDKPRRLSTSELVGEGGWYLDHQLLRICYMPRGHADPTLAAWAEFAALIGRSEGQVNATQSARGTVRAAVPGDCRTCHIFEKTTPGLGSNWHSIARPETVKTFTKFDHTPHLALPALSDCRYCHALEKNVPTPDRISQPPMGTGEVSHHFSDTGTGAFEEFVPLQRAQCVACHRAGGANDGCTQCHNYHVGSQGWQWSSLRRTQ